MIICDERLQIAPAKLGCNPRALGRKAAVAPKQVARNTVAAAVSGEVPDMGKRNVMNLLLVGAIGLPATSLVGGFAYFDKAGQMICVNVLTLNHSPTGLVLCGPYPSSEEASAAMRVQ